MVGGWWTRRMNEAKGRAKDNKRVGKWGNPEVNNNPDLIYRLT